MALSGPINPLFDTFQAHGSKLSRRRKKLLLRINFKSAVSRRAENSLFGSFHFVGKRSLVFKNITLVDLGTSFHRRRKFCNANFDFHRSGLKQLVYTEREILQIIGSGLLKRV